MQDSNELHESNELQEEQTSPPTWDIPLNAYMDDLNAMPNPDDWVNTAFRQDHSKLSKQAIQDERALIGAFIAEESSSVGVREFILRLHSDWFRNSYTLAAFTALMYQAKQGKSLSVSALTLYSQLQKTYKAKEGSVEDAIAYDLAEMQKEWQKRSQKLTDEEKANLIGNIIEFVHDRYKQATLLNFSKKLPQLLKSDQPDKEKFTQIKLAVSVMSNTFDYSKGQIQSLSNVAKAILERASELADRDDKHRILGFSTGYPVIDEEINGVCGGKYYIVAARPSMGKTTLILNIIYNMAKAGIPVVFFSYEMSKKQVVEKLLGMMTKIRPKRLTLGDLTADEWTRFTKATDDIAKLPIDIYDMEELGSNDVSLMIERCRELQKEKNLGVAFVDYVQLLKDVSVSSADKSAVLEGVSNKIQQATRKYGLPIIGVAQLNRNIEQRKDKTPTMSDLKGTGAFEQDSDCIMFLHRDEYYQDGEKDDIAEVKVSPESSLVSVIFAKNREGEQHKTVSLTMNGPLGIFSSLDAINMLNGK